MSFDYFTILIILAYCIVTFLNSYVSLALSATRQFKSACEKAKEKCNNETDCFHRILYIQATCVTGGGFGDHSCKMQCKTGVLRLFQAKYGREILESDMNCIGSVKSEIEDCNLDPKGDVHCTLAHNMCEGDELCKRLLDAYEMQCEEELKTGCSNKCVGLLNDVFAHEIGVKLKNCVCWSDDPLCQHSKSVLIDPCKEKIDLFNRPNSLSLSTVVPSSLLSSHNNITTARASGVSLRISLLSVISFLTVIHYVG